MLTDLSRRGLVALLLVACTAAIAGPAVAPAASSCLHSDLVFYTTDSVRLATELANTPAACADYYISVTPSATGAPRGGAPVTAIHSFGAHFHALAEIRLPLWTVYAAANGWYAAGVEARRQMAAAGYDVGAGDSWAVNEVGAPSGSQLGVDVLNGAGASRQQLRDFVHGLYVGDGSATSSGVVFAADPLQVTGDVSGYRQSLRSWYADSGFWQDMSRYVRAWAQETYADARAWGVGGAAVADRTAYLDDYFLHAARLAAGGDGRTDSARAFFARAYTPLGNASYRWPAPDTTTGIGFGDTDVDQPTMLSFVSAQTYALHAASPQRFGFAVVPHTVAATDTLAVYDRLGAAIQGAGAGAAACTGCDAVVPGAAFNDAWKQFANTIEGSHVRVRSGAVKVTFADVTARGATQAVAAGRHAYAISTTAVYTGPLEVCIAAPRTAGRWRLVRGRVDVTTVAARSFACGRSTTLGTFALR